MEKVNFLDEKVTEIVNEIEHVKKVLSKKRELVYDKSSGDSAKNWGKPNGLTDGTTIEGRDFSDYNNLLLYLRLGSSRASFSIDLDCTLGGSYTATLATSEIVSNALLHITCLATVNEGKTNISLSFFKNSSSFNGSQDYFCYKIEGFCD